MPNNHAAQPEEDLVRLYLNDIGKHALLTKDDEARLAVFRKLVEGRVPAGTAPGPGTGSGVNAVGDWEKSNMSAIEGAVASLVLLMCGHQARRPRMRRPVPAQQAVARDGGRIGASDPRNGYRAVGGPAID